MRLADGMVGCQVRTLWGFRSVDQSFFVRHFLASSTGRWADTAAIVQPNW